MKISLICVGIIAGVVTAANLAIAGSFDGIYRAEPPCSFSTNFDHQGDKNIYFEGTTIVHEMVPMTFWGTDLYPAIIFQKPRDFLPVFSLGIGEVQQSFIYNSPANYSQGSYSEDGSVFEQLGGARTIDEQSRSLEYLDTVKLERTSSGMRLTSTNRTSNDNASPVVCSFVFERALGR
ncbi:MAG TPA: hypothetical protein VEL47_04980 [Myxococcota bacterium]|nr:hypothetical protein [Myxococcota bacterium]